jgi:hypothetical protein
MTRTMMPMQTATALTTGMTRTAPNHEEGETATTATVHHKDNEDNHHQEWGQQSEDKMTPGPGDDRHEDDQHQGNGDSEDHEDDNSRDDRNVGCQEQPGTKGTTGTRSKQRGTQMTRPWPRQQRQQCQQEQHTAHPRSWAQMATRVVWAQVIFFIFVSYFLFKIYIVSLDAIY